MSVDKTLEERGARYGQFADHAAIAQGLQETLVDAPNWFRLKPDVRQMLVVLTDKMARILNGDPDYIDNYHDIQGYAKLVEGRLKKEEAEASAQNAKLFAPATGGVVSSGEGTFLINNDDILNFPISTPEKIRNDQDRRDGKDLTFPEHEAGPDARIQGGDTVHHSEYYYDTERNR